MSCPFLSQKVVPTSQVPPLQTTTIPPLTDDEKTIIKSTVPILAESGVALIKYFYNRMLTAHPELKNQFSATHQETGAQPEALAHAVHAYAANIDDLTPLLPTVKHIVNKHCSVGVTSDQYNIVGTHLIASLMEVLKLDKNSPIISAWTKAYNLLADIFIKAEHELYTSSSSLENHGWYGYRDFIITSKVHESDNITSYYLSPRDGLYPLPKPQAGQYIAVRLYVKKLNCLQIRQYTITDHNEKYYRISVKKDIGVSMELNDCKLKVSTIELTVPYGEYTLSNTIYTPLSSSMSSSSSSPSSSSDLVFISAGIGITPIYSLATQLINDDAMNKNKKDIDNNKRKLLFLHGTQNSNTLFHDAINKITHTQKFSTKLYFSKPIQDQDILGKNYDVKGRIDLSTDELLSISSLSNASYFVCGPPSFMKDIHKQLINKGVKKHNIHMELFSTGPTPS